MHDSKPRAIPEEGLTFHATVVRVNEDGMHAALHAKARYEARLTADGLDAELKTDYPLPFHGEFDLTIKPAPQS